MLLLVVVTEKQEVERLPRQRGDELGSEPHEQVLVIRQEGSIEVDARILTLRYEPVQVELGPAALKDADSFVDNDQQLGNFLQRTSFEAQLGFLIDKDVIVTGNGGQRAPANANFGVDSFKRAFRKLST